MGKEGRPAKEKEIAMDPLKIALLTGMTYEEAYDSWAAQPENKEQAEKLVKFCDDFMREIRGLTKKKQV